MRKVSHYVLAGLDGPPADTAVTCAAQVMGDILGVPVRTVHVASGPGLRGEARRSALTRVQLGETAEVPGRPEDVLASLVEAPATDLAVFGARQRPRRPGGRRVAGTAIAVARRVTRPMLLVPPDVTSWAGPGRVLTLLDGTGATALAAASALAAISRPDTFAVALHVTEDHSARRATEGAAHRAPDSVAHGAPAEGADELSSHLPTRPAKATALTQTPAVHAGTTSRQVLDAVASSDCDLVVLVWERRTRGSEGAAVLDVLASSPVPVLLVPAAATS